MALFPRSRYREFVPCTSASGTSASDATGETTPRTAHTEKTSRVRARKYGPWFTPSWIIRGTSAVDRASTLPPFHAAIPSRDLGTRKGHGGKGRFFRTGRRFPGPPGCGRSSARTGTHGTNPTARGNGDGNENVNDPCARLGFDLASIGGFFSPPIRPRHPRRRRSRGGNGGRSGKSARESHESTAKYRGVGRGATSHEKNLIRNRVRCPRADFLTTCGFRGIGYSAPRPIVVSPSSWKGPVRKISSAFIFFPAWSGLGPQSAVKLPQVTPNEPPATTFPSSSTMR